MIQSVQGEDMKVKLTINLIKEYLKLAILPYCIAALVWTMMIFIGTGYDWALVGAMCGSMVCAAWGWKMIFTDSAKGGRSGLYQGLPVSSAKQQSARVLAAAMGILIVLAGFAAMTVLIWETIEF